MYEELMLISLDEDIDIELVILTDEEIEEEVLRQMENENEPIILSKLVSRVVKALKSRGYSVSEDRVRKIVKGLIKREKIAVMYY